MTPSATASYHSVAILAPGEFTDMSGRRVSFSAAQLAALASRYRQSPPALLNLDHRSSGPALGRIRALRYDDARGLLLADIDGVPPRLARAIERGRWPGRSAELAVERDEQGQARLQLRGLALLGARRPAVEGLPPMPPRADPPEDDSGRGGPWSARAGNAGMEDGRTSVRPCPDSVLPRSSLSLRPLAPAPASVPHSFSLTGGIHD